MAYRALASFKAPQVAGMTREHVAATREEAEQWVMSGKFADMMMTIVDSKWETEYTITEVDTEPLDDEFDVDQFVERVFNEGKN